MTDTKHKFSSFAAPTPEDIAAFQALSHEEQGQILKDEITKGFEGPFTPWTADLSENIKRRALERAAKRHAPR